MSYIISIRTFYIAYFLPHLLLVMAGAICAYCLARLLKSSLRVMGEIFSWSSIYPSPAPHFTTTLPKLPFK